MQKIVTIGGGTGHFQVLRGLKNYECQLTAVVNMSDDGGSSGKLRDEYGVLPPGDVRQCMVALADEKKGRLLRDLFKHRFKDGHNLGNLIITALTQITGSAAEGIKEAAKLLHIAGKVLPVTTDDVKLFAETDDNVILEGQWNVSYPEQGVKIKKIFFKPDAFVFKEAADEIRSADKVVICPGDFYGSVVPNFLVKGISEALHQSRALKIFVCNIVTKQGNENFKAGDFVAEAERYAGIKFDKILLNSGLPPKEVVDTYLSEHSRIVADDLLSDLRVVRGDFVQAYPSEPKTILRHIPEKIARAIISL